MLKVKVLIAEQFDKSGFKVVKVYSDHEQAIKDCDMLRDHGDMSKNYLLYDSDTDLDTNKLII